MNTRTVVVLYRIAGALFALASGINVFSAYRAHQKAEPIGFYAALAVTYLALAVVFVTLGWIKAAKKN